MRDKLLFWYQNNKRDLPWRRRHGAYAVLVSEMMLQQTTVETVLRYYEPFLERFPDVYALAAADEQDVLTAWKGLGYYSRARNLHRIAQMVIDEYNGVFPDSHQEWLAMPGVGPYMAGAVMSIAFGKPYPAVDGNVLRVISRLFALREDITHPKARREAEVRVAAMMNEKDAGDLTQALMELGALVCRPASPACAQCPLQDDCAALREGVVEELPVRKAREKPRVVKLWAAVIEKPGALVLEYRKNDTLLARLWGLPTAPRQDAESAEAAFAARYGIALTDGQMIGKAVHVFTHQRWEMNVVRFGQEIPLRAEWEWVPWDKMDEKAVPTAFMKAIDAADKRREEIK